MNVALWLSTQAPALPQAWAMQVDVSLGWALVLALLVAVLGARLALPVRRLLAWGLALWTLLPGPLSLDYWLGLAFHAPSLSAQLLCLVFLQRLLYPARTVATPPTAATTQAEAAATHVQERFAPVPKGLLWVLLGAGVLLGYGLLLDTFAVLPQQVYAWGFSPALLLGLLALSLLPWVLRGAAADAKNPTLWLVPLALLLFAITRLPTGNVWDAVLDPWLWVLLQLAGLRGLFRALFRR